MRFQSIAAVACLAVASHAANTAPHVIFGLSARSDDKSHYVPTQTLCGMGDTCAEACGATFDMCPSSDESIHCFDKASQKCCPGNNGVSCDAGYYCANNAEGQQLCCPEGKSLAECAGAVASLAPLALTTAVPSSTVTTQNLTVATTAALINSTSIFPTGTGAAKPTGVASTTIRSSAGSGSGSSTPVPTAQPSASQLPVGAGNALAPAGMVVLAVAGFAAALL